MGLKADNRQINRHVDTRAKNAKQFETQVTELSIKLEQAQK